MPFVDTNILLYRVSSDAGESLKHEIASTILERDDLFLSIQVLQEFYVQATRPSRADRLTHEEATTLIASWKRYPILDLDVSLLEAALDTKQRWQVSYWDAAIIEAARRCGCGIEFSEDLSDGQDYGGVVVVNPFRV